MNRSNPTQPNPTLSQDPGLAGRATGPLHPTKPGTRNHHHQSTRHPGLSTPTAGTTSSRTTRLGAMFTRVPSCSSIASCSDYDNILLPGFVIHCHTFTYIYKHYLFHFLLKSYCNILLSECLFQLPELKVKAITLPYLGAPNTQSIPSTGPRASAMMPSAKSLCLQTNGPIQDLSSEFKLPVLKLGMSTFCLCNFVRFLSVLMNILW